MSLNQAGFKLTTREYFFMLLFFGTILIVPLIGNKIIPGHDYVFHVTRILDVASGLREGIFPVRIYVDEIHFWGIPLGIFYPGLFIYVPALLSLLGVPIEICYNIFTASIFYMGLIASWKGFSILTRSRIAGFFSAILYISSGWFLIDAYIRNALGELIALAFLPLAIACIMDLIVKPKVLTNRYILGIISISAIIESHVLTSAFLVAFSLFFISFHYKYVSLLVIKRLFIFLVIIFSLNATFIIPFLFYYIKVPVMLSYIDYFTKESLPIVVLLHLFITSNIWLLISLYFFFSIYYHRHKKLLFFSKTNLYSGKLLLFIQYCLWGLLFAFLSSNLMPWDSLPSLKRIFQIMQFPWRFLGITTLFFCICGGCGLRLLFRKFKIGTRSIVLLTSIICLTNLVVLTYAEPFPFEKIKQKISWERFISDTDDDYLYKDMNVKALFSQGNRYFSNAEIFNMKKNLTSVSFSYFARSTSTITLPLVNYPGYIASDQDGNELVIRENENHMVVIPLTKGIGEVHVQFVGLPIFRIADYISIIALLLLIYLYTTKYNRIHSVN